MGSGCENIRSPWNKGKLIGRNLPLNAKEIWAVRFRLQLEHRTRDLALFTPARSPQQASRNGRSTGSNDPKRTYRTQSANPRAAALQ